MGKEKRTGHQPKEHLQPTDNMALYSLFKITVLCVLFHEVAAIDQVCTKTPPPCSGKRSEHSPDSKEGSVYSAGMVPTPHGVFVTHVELTFYTVPEKDPSDVLYQLDVQGCTFDPTPPYECKHKSKPLFHPKNYTGYFIDSKDNTGSILIPVADQNHGGDHHLTMGEMVTNMIFGHGIQWCPDYDRFVLNVPAIGTKGAQYCKLPHVKMMYAAVPATSE